MMIEGIAAVVFDWAGTVVDFGSRAPALAFVRLFEAQGIALTEAQAREPMGLPKRDHIAALCRMPAVQQAWLQRFGQPTADADIDRLYEQYLPLNAHTVTEHAELVPGTVEVVQWLRSRGVSVGSNTGYGRELITPLLPLAAAQGFEPDCVICADDVPFSRPSPMALYRAFIELGTWPARRVVKVDDTVPGLLEGRHAGCWTVGVLSSGNEVGLSLAQWQALSADERAVRLQRARVRLSSCDPDYLIPSVADLPGVIEMIERRLIAGDRPKVD
ncbi:MAG: phosphonoacetaldehyde hydrolase [Rubrivivax sp.]|jgi:phosphonoacetaldehyde hydrolase|nr:phosphonoacetaldehyde hydrolase [Rubrivivax sp.]